MRSGSTEFWRAIITLGALGMAWFLVAAWSLFRTWQTGSGLLRPRPRLRRPGARLPDLDGSLEAADLCCWLAKRTRPPRWAAWGIVGFLIALWAVLMSSTFWISGRPQRELAFFSGGLLAWGIHVVFKAIIAIQASRSLSEDFHNGALELLASPPFPRPPSWPASSVRWRISSQTFGGSWPWSTCSSCCLGSAFSAHGDLLPRTWSPLE